MVFGEQRGETREPVRELVERDVDWSLTQSSPKPLHSPRSHSQSRRAKTPEHGRLASLSLRPTSVEKSVRPLPRVVEDTVSDESREGPIDTSENVHMISTFYLFNINCDDNERDLKAGGKER